MSQNSSDKLKSSLESDDCDEQDGIQIKRSKRPVIESDEDDSNEEKLDSANNREKSINSNLNKGNRSKNISPFSKLVENISPKKMELLKPSENESLKKPINLFNQSSKMTESKAKVDPINYNPSKTNYDPIEDCAWNKGEKVPYLCLAKTFQAIEDISSRLKMIETLANYFWSVMVQSPSDLLPSVYLSLNQLGPGYEGLELGIGESLIIKALGQATGRKAHQIKNEIEKKGDLGLVAESSRVNQRVMFEPPKLTISSVFTKLREIALLSGHSMATKKIEKIQSMLVACRDCEARYLVRSLAGKIRIGLAEQSLLAALSQAILLATEEKCPRGSDVFKKKLETITQTLKSTYCQCPNYDKIISVLLEEGWQELSFRCQLSPGIPLKPMLAHPTKGVEEILRRFEDYKFTCEFKYDGERAQIHVLPNKNVYIYSRNQENNTSKYPDIISRMNDVLKKETDTCILDCEAVAWDVEKKQILPFQVLSTRKRKDAQEEEIKVQVCLFAFDLLYVNGESLIKKPLRERRDKLYYYFNEIQDKFMFAKSKDVETIDEVAEYLDESIKGKCEGLMVKTLDHEATYEIAKRSHSWLKVNNRFVSFL